MQYKVSESSKSLQYHGMINNTSIWTECPRECYYFLLAHCIFGQTVSNRCFGYKEHIFYVNVFCRIETLMSACQFWDKFLLCIALGARIIVTYHNVLLPYRQRKTYCVIMQHILVNTGEVVNKVHSPNLVNSAVALLYSYEQLQLQAFIAIWCLIEQVCICTERNVERT